MGDIGVGQAGAAKDDKPQVQAGERNSAGAEKAFNEALGQSAGSASGTKAAAHATGGKPAIVRIDANYRSKSATATLSDGSKVPLGLTKNQLEPGDTLHNLEYGPESGPEDARVVELSCASGASCSILWTQPSDYALSPKVIVSIKQDPEEGARRRLEQLPQYIQDYVNQVGGRESLQSRAKMGEDLLKSGAKKEDFAPVEIEAKAPADPDFHFVEAARKGWYSKFPSFDEFKKDLEAQVSYAKQQARTNGLNPPDPFEGAEWKDNPAAAKEKWDKFVFAEYDKALKNEAAGLRHVGEVASMATNAIFEELGLSAVVGTGGAVLAAGGEALALPTLLESSTGVSTNAWLGTFAKFGLGVSFGSNLISRGKEGIDAGSDPVSIGATALTDTFGGRVFEKINNESNLTGEKLNLSTGERVIGGFMDVLDGGMNFMGVHEFVKPPGVAEPPVPRRTPAEPTVNETLTPTETPRDLFAEAMKRLPDAEKLSAASKAQRGIPDYMLGMATPGGPSSMIQRGLIELWLGEGTLGLDESRMLMRMLFEEHPVLNDLAATQTAAAGLELRTQLNGIMQGFADETGVPITVVPDGTVQAARGTGDFGSMRSRPGYYEIEQSVYNDDIRLRNELSHQIPAYFGSRISPENFLDWQSPVTADRNQAEWLEYFVKRGAPPPAAE